MKGLSIFELLAGLDDDMIAAATLPETSAAAVKPPRRRWRKGAISDFLNNGWVAACASVVIALGVLVAIIAAGQHGKNSDGRENYTLPPSPVTDTHDETSDPDPDPDPDSETNREPETEPEADPYPLPAYVETVNAFPLSISSGDRKVYPKAYLVSRNSQWRDENGALQGEDTDGYGAADRVDEILGDLTHLVTGGSYYTLAMPSYMTLSQARLFEIRPDGTTAEIPLPRTDPPSAALNYALTRSPGKYVVVLCVRSHEVFSEDEYKDETREYAMRLTVEEGGTWLDPEDVTEPVTEPSAEGVTEPVTHPIDPSIPPVKVTVDSDPVPYQLKPSSLRIVNHDGLDPVAITSGNRTVFPKDYLVLHHITHYTETDENGKYREESTEGEGAVPLLDEILDELPHLVTTGESYTVSLPRHWNDDDLNTVRLFEVLPDGTTAEIPLPTTGHPDDEFPYGFPRTPGEYVVVLHTFTVYRLDDTAREIARLEYPFRLTVLPSGTDEPKVPFPRITLKTESSQLVFATRADGYPNHVGEQLTQIKDQLPTWTIRYGDVITTMMGDRREFLSVGVYDLYGEVIREDVFYRAEFLSQLTPGQYFVILSARKNVDPDSLDSDFIYHYYPLLLTVEPIDTAFLENNPAAVPIAPSEAYLTVEGGGYMVEFSRRSDGQFIYALDQDGTSSDGFGAYNYMIENSDKLTVLTVSEGSDLSATVRDNGDHREIKYHFKLYDINGQKIYNSTIPELQEGYYFIIALVTTTFDEYVPSIDAYTYFGYEYPLILHVKSPN